MAASAAMLLGCGIAASIAPRWIALAQEPLRFEVASVKPDPEHGGRGYRLHCEAGTRFDTIGADLRSMVLFAYGVSDFQISGGPAWISSRDPGFDIEARPPAPPVSSDDCRRMLQTLLADRFKLALHKETREMQVYALLVGSKGSKLHEATGEEPPWPGSSIMLNGASIQMNDGYSRPTARGMTMAQLARFLQGLPRVGAFGGG